jgi:hypothetical protein
MGTTQARIFRMALAELGDPDINPRVLDEVYSDAVNYCLEQGYWNFALSTAQLSTQGAVTQFGYTHASLKPSGWTRTVRVSDQTSYWPPLENYEDARSEIHSTAAPLYMVYVSNTATAGLRLAEWPDAFAQYVAGELARRVCRRAKLPEKECEKLNSRVRGYLVNALLKDSFDGGSLARKEDIVFAAGSMGDNGRGEDQ